MTTNDGGASTRDKPAEYGEHRRDLATSTSWVGWRICVTVYLDPPIRFP